MKKLTYLVLIFGLVFQLTGCASKAKPAPSAGFVTESIMEHQPDLPFHKVWKSADFDKSNYQKLYVASVNTDYMLKMTEWQEGIRKDEFKEDVRQIAAYAREAVKKAFREDSQHRFLIVNTPEKTAGTINLEIAITEVVPSKVALNALGYAPFGIGFAVKAVRKMADDVSTVALEVKGVDAATGKTMFMIADRNAQQTTLVSGRDFTWYGHAYSIIDQWAKKLVEVANRAPGEQVKDTAAFTLKPW